VLWIMKACDVSNASKRSSDLSILTSREYIISEC
jgi:hypothetical protein